MDSTLYKAATQGDVQALNRLIEQNLNILYEAVTPQENTALHLAARHGHKLFAQEILRACSTVLKTKNIDLRTMKNIDDDTPLHVAARAGHLEIVKLLIDKPTDVESRLEGQVMMRNKMHNTPLHEAVKNCYPEIAKVLLDAEPSAGHARNEKGETPLHIAAREGLKEVVSEILGHPSVEEEEGEPPLAEAGSPLHQAVLGGHFDIVQMLLDKRSDYTKVTDIWGNNALHYAALKNDGKMVDLLLKHKPSLAYDKNFEDERSSLHVAAASNSIAAIKEILRLCPDAAEQLDKEGRNALHIAVISRAVAALKCLLKNVRPAEIINQADQDGNTPLHLAAKKSRIHSTILLLDDRRVDPCIVNKADQTPRRIIESFDYMDTYEMHLWQLLKHTEERRCKKQHQLSESEMTASSFRKKPPKDITSKADEHFKASVGTYALVSALIATVTFAAIFTMPGGYSQEHGYALLAKHAAFKAFVISNTIAMCSSLVVVFCFIWAWKDPLRFKVRQLMWGHRLTVVASLAMLVALMTAVYVVLESQCKWVAIVVCLICCSAPFILWAILGRDILFIPV